MRVLIIEDEMSMADAIGRGLTRKGFEVEVAYDGDEGFALLNDSNFDVLILDRDLPGMSGDDICRSISGRISTKIIMLTASVFEQDRAEGLALGADDYLGKPFGFAELLERVQALGRAGSPTH
jgi:DNA-binding response OmpR family regulator